MAHQDDGGTLLEARSTTKSDGKNVGGVVKEPGEGVLQPLLSPSPERAIRTANIRFEQRPTNAGSNGVLHYPARSQAIFNEIDINGQNPCQGSSTSTKQTFDDVHLYTDTTRQQGSSISSSNTRIAEWIEASQIVVANIQFTSHQLERLEALHRSQDEMRKLLEMFHELKEITQKHESNSDHCVAYLELIRVFQKLQQRQLRCEGLQTDITWLTSKVLRGVQQPIVLQDLDYIDFRRPVTERPGRSQIQARRRHCIASLEKNRQRRTNLIVTHNFKRKHEIVIDPAEMDEIPHFEEEERRYTREIAELDEELLACSQTTENKSFMIYIGTEESGSSY